MSLIKMKAPGTASSLSHGGKEYQVEKGHVEIPPEAQAAAETHGFTLADGKAAEKAPDMTDGEKAAAEFVKPGQDKVIDAIGAAPFNADTLTLFKDAQVMEGKGKNRTKVLEALAAAVTKLETPSP